MTLILDPMETADDAGFEGIRTLVGITLTDDQINMHPLFDDSEEFIVSVVPASALPSGRSYADRNRVIRALQFLTKYAFLYDSASSGSSTSGGGMREVRAESETIGPITKRTEYGSFGGTTTKDYTHGVDNQTEFYLQSAYRILTELNPNFNIPDHHSSIIGGIIPVEAATTSSEEVEFDDFLYYLERQRLNRRTP